MDYKHETIAAIATPVGIGGIGIIKISGSLAEGIAQKVFRPKHPANSLDNFRLYLGYIMDPDAGVLVDEVLLSIMRGPLSYTREDVVEINSHSGYTVLSRILRIILQSGARLARPGEFTLRAFINGRIDLTEAEAVVDLINAKSETSLDSAARQLTGGLLTSLEEIRKELIEALVDIEACIDFPDEQPTRIDRQNMANRVHTAVLKPIAALIAAYPQRKIWYEGLVLAIVGRVNVGKSSILNRLARKERALVTPVPGTTRDIIECGVNIKGMPVRLMDTAGIRKVRGIVERKGVDLTVSCLASADIILLVIDGSRPLNRYDLDHLSEVKKKNSIVVINKIDLPQKISEKTLERTFHGLQKVYVSAITGEGFSDLIDAVYNLMVHKFDAIPSAPLIPNLRQALALREASSLIENAVKGITDGLPLEISAADLASAKCSIDEITGYKINEEVIEGIFSKFCVGK